MIFKKEDIEFLKLTSEDVSNVEYRVHKPSGVFFAEYINDDKSHDYFVVARLLKDGDFVESKAFYKKTQEEFFEAVKYFESLVSKSTPQPKENPPSVGIFVFQKKEDLMSFVKINDLVVTMSNEDVYKSFTPPKTKPFGKLDITILSDPKYDPIKYKFACNYDENLSKEISEKSGLTVDDLFVYQLTPYQTQEGAEQNPDQNPESVSDEQLNPGDIEGESPEDLKGSDQDQQQTQPGEPSDDGQQQPQPGDDGQPQPQPGDDGQPQPQPGDDGQPQPQPGDDGQPQPQPGDDGQPQPQPGDDGQPQPQPGDDGQPQPQPGDDGQPQPQPIRKPGDFTGRDSGTPTGYEDQGYQHVEPKDFREKLSRILGVEDVEYAYGKQERLINKLNSLNNEALEPIYKAIGMPDYENRSKLIEEVKKITKPYFE